MGGFVVLIIVGSVFLLIGSGLLYYGRKVQSKTDLLKRIGTSKANDIAGLIPGEMVEVKGMVRSNAPLIAEISQRPCVWYHTQVTREYERRERDSKGNWSTNRGSETVSTNENCISFYVEDESGRVEIQPYKAEADLLKVVDRFEDANDAAGPTISIGGVSLGLGGNSSRTLGYRHVEKILPVDVPVYVIGAVQETPQIGAPLPVTRNGRFIISHRTEEVLQQDWAKQARWLAYGALGSFAVGLILLIIALVTLAV